MTKPTPWYFSAITGLLSGGTALVVGEIAAGFGKNTSTIIEGFGDALIDSSLLPNSLREFSINTVGTTQKPLLIAGVITTILLISIGLSMLTGWLGSPKIKNLPKKISRFRFLIAAVVISIFGILSGLSLSQGIDSSSLYASLTSLIASAFAFFCFIFSAGDS